MESAAVSPVFTVQGLQWQIAINKHENKKFPSLGQYLGFNLCVSIKILLEYVIAADEITLDCSSIIYPYCVYPLMIYWMDNNPSFTVCI